MDRSRTGRHLPNKGRLDAKIASGLPTCMKVFVKRTTGPRRAPPGERADDTFQNLLRNDEVRTLALCRVGTNPYGDACRLNHMLHINVPEGEFTPAYGEVDLL
jgi:hypothetical protein